MKKCILVVFCFFAVTFFAAADTPPGGENLFLLGFPEFYTTAYSSSGGAVFDPGPFSININPALTAPLQRIAFDIGYSGLLRTKSVLGIPVDSGTALHLGALYPTRWGVWTAVLQYSYSAVLPKDNVFNGRLGWSRDITDTVYLGASIYAASINNTYDVSGKGSYSDFAAALDLGFVWRVGNLGILKDMRFSGAVNNIGKTFKNGILTYPGILTVRGGLAALLVDSENISFGFSADAVTPTFHTVILDIGLQAKIAKVITLSAGWDFDFYENGKYDALHSPSVGISFNLSVETGKSEFMNSKGLKRSDFKPTFVWHNLGGGVQAIAAGLAVKLGEKDTDAPEIELGGGE